MVPGAPGVVLSSRHRAGVLGSPVAHSLSPVLHRAAYAGLGLTGWEYTAIEVGDQPALRAFLDGCDASWAGLSLTMPLKRWVRPLLDEESAVARATQAVNTVLFEGARRSGHNTDVAGLVAALAEQQVGTVDRAVVLGGGATAASAVAALVELGCRRPTVVVRSPARAQDVLRTGEVLGGQVGLVGWDAAAPLLVAAEVVVSTVPLPAAGTVSEAVAAAARAAGGPLAALLFDVLYHPWPTPVATAWQHAGGRAAGGFGMLLHQAAAQVRLMTGQQPDLRRMRAAGLAALG